MKKMHTVKKLARSMRKRLGCYEALFADVLDSLAIPYFSNKVFRLDDGIWSVPDFYVESAKTVFEIDGGVHSIPSVAAKDRLKEEGFQRRGIRVVRIPNDLFETDPKEVERIVRRVIYA